MNRDLECQISQLQEDRKEVHMPSLGIVASIIAILAGIIILIWPKIINYIIALYLIIIGIIGVITYLH